MHTQVNLKVDKKDHTHFYIGGSDDSPKKRQSLWRKWNRLSSLQRSIICLIIIMGAISALYIVPLIIKDYKKLDQLQLDMAIREKQQRIELAQKQVDESKKFLDKAVKTIHSKAVEHLKLPNVPENLGPTNKEQRAIVAAFKHSWKAYRKYAWGQDELMPMTKTYNTWFGVGLAILDALDTMYIMGLKDEFKEARDWVDKKLSFDVSRDVNLFETTIRCLGGLLSTYHLTKDKVFLTKATDLGNRLLPAYRTVSGVPYSDVNLASHRARTPRWGTDSSTSEVSTVQLEMRDLSRLTGDPKYEAAAHAVTKHLHRQLKRDGLVPMYINPNTGLFRKTSTITLGARADSYYEYLLKIWLQTGKTNDDVKNDYLEAVEGIKKNLMRESQPNKYVFFGELLAGTSFSPKMDHLVCFLAGTLALGTHHGLPADHMDLGKKFAKTCWEMYHAMPTGLSPEIVYFNTALDSKQDIYVKPADTHNLERPETVESLFYLYRLTKDPIYRQWGWYIFNAFERYTKLDEGYSSINNVKNPGRVNYRNKMETFWLGETLKYLYLLFSDDPQLFPLDQWVFNTEGHPLPIRNS